MDSRLYKAITTGDIDGLRRLIANDGEDLLLQMTTLNNTTLHVAVQFESKVCVGEILNRFPSLLLQQNLKEDTPLHIAAMLGLSDIVEFLILRALIIHQAGVVQGGRRGSSTTVLQQLVRMNKENDTALHEAVRYNRFEIVRSLTEADPTYEYLPNKAGETPLFLAAEAGLYKFVAQILDKCPTSDHRGPRGLTALHVGAMNGYSDIARLLLEQKPGTIIKEIDENGCSALHYSAHFRRAEMAAQLLTAEPSIGNMSDKDDKTALHIAANNIMPKTVAYMSDRDGITLHKVMDNAFSKSVLPKEFERYGVTTTYFYDYDEKFKKRSAEVIKEVSGLCPESLEWNCQTEMGKIFFMLQLNVDSSL